MMKTPIYQAPDMTLWQGRSDTLPNERFFQCIKGIDCRSVQPNADLAHHAFLGFCSDEGIRRNQGRLGARMGPNALRKQLAQLAYHGDKRFLDLGNIVCPDEKLELAQQQFAKLIAQCHQQNLITIALGGGHEIAWAHFQGLAPHYRHLGIINFDAHFDIRLTTKKSYGTSGTPFAQIKQYCDENQRPFHYACFGIQPAANARSLFNRAKDWNVIYLTAEQIVHDPFESQVQLINEFMMTHDAIYLSICLDVFAECYAPGVSAPQSLGIHPWQTIPLLKIIAQSGKVKGLDIAELSPGLDENDKTSRLAARLLAELL